MENEVRLTEAQMKRVAELIADADDYKDYVTFRDEKEDLEIDFDFEREVDGYVEDDYDNGTGAWVCTHVEVYITDSSLPLPSDQLERVARLAEELIAA
jgi:hypothetical protein